MRFYWKYRVRQILFWGWGIFVGGGVQYIFMWVTLLLLFYLSLYQQVFMWNCPFPPTLHEREYEKSLPSIKNSHMEQNTCLFFFFGREGDDEWRVCKAQADLELAILLFLLPKCSDNRCVLSCLAKNALLRYLCTIHL